MNSFLIAPLETAIQVLCIAVPLALAAVVLRLLNIVIQGRLARWFGWNAVLFTGWLGTPIHELSHALMCVIFRHRIVEMALFRPDKESRQLGFVDHSYVPKSIYSPKNIYQVLGNFFIGTAPLVGGTLVMYGLLWLFYPSAAGNAVPDSSVGDAIAKGEVVSAAGQVTDHALGVLRQVVSIEHLATIKLWLFIYLVLCVGSHMAPSRSDYRGSKWGAVVLVGAMLLINILFQTFGGDPSRITLLVSTLIGMALGLWVLSILFCGVAALLVLIGTGLMELLTERRR
jgi:hypothetical protein